MTAKDEIHHVPGRHPDATMPGGYRYKVAKLRRMTDEERAAHMPEVPADRAYMGLDAQGRPVTTYTFLYSEEQEAQWSA